MTTTQPGNESKQEREEFVAEEWAGEEPRVEWEERIKRVRALWWEVEWRAVAVGIRRCALKSVPIASLDKFTQQIVREGLSVVPIELRRVPASYHAVATVVSASDEVPDESLHVLCAIAKPSDAASAADCAVRTAHVPLGRLLGYPECCTASFEYAWSRRKMTDPTWSMGCATRGARIESNSCEVSGHWAANVLLRWIGVRAVPHLPCRFDCQQTVELGSSLLGLATEIAREKDVISYWEEMLRWPVEWIARQETADIRLPIMTIQASTDRANDGLAVQLAQTSGPRC